MSITGAASAIFTTPRNANKQTAPIECIIPMVNNYDFENIFDYSRLLVIRGKRSILGEIQR